MIARVRVLMMSTARHRVHEPRSPDTARFIIIDHDPVFRVVLRRRSGAVAHAANVAVGLVLVRDGLVDIVVLGLDAISNDSAGLISGLARHPTRVGVIVVSACEGPQHPRAAFRAGARGFLLKRTVADEVVRAIDAVRAGGQYVALELAARSITMHVPKRRRPRAPGDDRSVALTWREFEVLNHASRGLTNAEVARELGLSAKTVKNYMSIILAKLQARSRLEAVLKYRGSALLP